MRSLNLKKLQLKPFAFLFQADERIARYLPFPQLQIWRLPGKKNVVGHSTSCKIPIVAF
jgi:hypothetical protein